MASNSPNDVFSSPIFLDPRTPSAPRAPVVPQAKQDIADRATAAEQKRIQDETSFSDTVGAAGVEGTIGLADRVLTTSQMRVDPNYGWKESKAFAERLQKAGLGSQVELASNAFSKEHEDYLFDQAYLNVHAAETMRSSGVVAGLAAGALDPGMIALDAVASPVAAAAFFGRAGKAARAATAASKLAKGATEAVTEARAIRAGYIGASTAEDAATLATIEKGGTTATEAATKASQVAKNLAPGRLKSAAVTGGVGAAEAIAAGEAESHYNPEMTGADIAGMAAASFIFAGGISGFADHEVAHMAKSAERIANEARTGNMADSMGSARVRTGVSSVDGPEINLSEAAQKRLDDAYANSHIQVAFANARRDISARFNKMNSALSRDFGWKSVRDGVGAADKTIAQGETASQMAHRTEALMQSKWQPAVNSAWTEHARDNGLRMFDTAGRADFFEQVGDHIRNPKSDAPPAVKRLASEAQHHFDEVRQHMQANGVPGWEGITSAADYLPRVPKRRGFEDVFGAKTVRHADFIENVVMPAMRSKWEHNVGEGGVNEDTLKAVATAWLDRMHTKAMDQGQALHMNLSMKDTDSIEALLRGAGVEESKIQAMVEPLKAGNKERAGHARTKTRIDMDEKYRATLTGDDGKEYDVGISDLLENNIQHIIPSYGREQMGWAALHQKLGIGSQSELDAYRLQMGEEAAKAKDDVAATHRLFDIATYSILGRSTSENPDAALGRWGRLVRDNAHLSMMGQVGFTMMAELGPTIAYAGLRATLKAVPEMKGMLKRMKNGTFEHPVANMLDDICAPGTDWSRNPAYLRTDDFGHGRWNDADVSNTVAGQINTKINSGLNKLDNAQQVAKRVISVASGMAPMQTLLQRFAARSSMHRLIDFANRDILKQAHIDRLRNSGMSEADQAMIFAKLKGTKNLDQMEKDFHGWTPQEKTALSSYMWNVTRHQVIEGDVGDTIQLMHSDIGKMFSQFRSFMTTSYTRHLLNGLHMRDWQTFGMMTTSTFFATMGMAARSYVNTIGDPEGRERQLAPGALFKAGFMQSSFSSIIPMVIDTAWHDIAQQDPVFAYGRSSGLQSGILGIPAIGTLQRLYAIAGIPAHAIDPNKQVTKQDFQAAWSALWFSNVTGWRNVGAAAARQLPDATQNQQQY